MTNKGNRAEPYRLAENTNHFMLASSWLDQSGVKTDYFIHIQPGHTSC